MPYTFPPAAPTLTGDQLSISRFLNTPELVARRLRTTLENRYIADYLLSQRFQVVGGAVVYETGESIFTTDAPRAVAPGSEYPLTTAATAAASLAATQKWGQDAKVTDEQISRSGMPAVSRVLTKLGNQNVKFVDSLALSAISSGVTQATAAAAAWTTATAGQILKDVAVAKANILALNQGYDPDTVVLSDLAWANAYAAFVTAGLLPREADNPLVTGSFPVIDGMTWLPTPNLPTAGQVLIADHDLLGGMADEDLGGGYAGTGLLGVQTKSIRDEDNDQWKIRVRRVTVPIVQEPSAAWKITGVGV
jgi:hypothetical protein